MSQTAAAAPKVVAEMPEFGQGEIAVNPSPEPSVKRAIETPRATTAPANTAAQLTAGAEDSSSSTGVIESPLGRSCSSS